MAEQLDRQAVLEQLRNRSNWGRWGKDDQKGAANLITPEKRVAAAALVRSGRTVSLSRVYPKAPGHRNPNPAQHYIRLLDRGEGSGAMVDYYGIEYHGFVSTHIDALCHIWSADGMWGGRDPAKVINTRDGSTWGDIDQWREGLITRGVLLDIPRFRKEPWVTYEKPVHGDELARIADDQGIEVQPGDALIIYAGRDAWEEANPDWTGFSGVRPGLHASCLKFIRDRDIAVLLFDHNEARPNEYGLAWTVKFVGAYYGVGTVNSVTLAPLAQACAEEGRYEFMLVISPLRVPGGSGSPVNPIAIF